MKKRILTVCDSAWNHDHLLEEMAGRNDEWEFISADSLEEARILLDRLKMDAVVAETGPQGSKEERFLRETRESHPEVMRIAVSGSSDPETLARLAGP